MTMHLTLDAIESAALTSALHGYDNAMLTAMANLRAAGLPDAAEAVRMGPRASLLALMARCEAAKDADGETECLSCGHTTDRGPVCGACVQLHRALGDGDAAEVNALLRDYGYDESGRYVAVPAAPSAPGDVDMYLDNAIGPVLGNVACPGCAGPLHANIACGGCGIIAYVDP